MYRLTKFVRDATISANRISTLPRAACQLPDRKFHLSSSKAERILGVGPVFVRCYCQAPVDRQGPGSDPKQFAEKTKETQEEDRTVVDYAENPRHYRQSHYREPRDKPRDYGEAMELIGHLKAQLGASTKIIWRATSRAAIEYFIDRHGKGAIVNYKNIPEAPTVVSWYERSRLIREEKLNWIFKNRASDLQVSLLMKAINASQQFTSLEEFCSYLSMAYDELSDQLKTCLVNPDVGAYDFQKVVISPEANQAIRVFMSRFDFSDFVVRKK